jgi:hypothetical protein
MDWIEPLERTWLGYSLLGVGAVTILVIGLGWIWNIVRGSKLR